MKKLIYSLIITAIISLGLHTSSVMAQGSLEFNQVKLISNSVETVPVGKVWKVTSLIPGGHTASYGSTNCTSGREQFRIAIDGDIHYTNAIAWVNTGSSGSVGSSTQSNVLPLWIPEGTTIATHCAQSKLSIIEFNVIP